MGLSAARFPLDAAGPSAQVSAKIAHSASQALPQQCSQCSAVNVANLGCDGVEVEPGAVQKRLCAFDPKVLEVGKRRLAKHRLAAALQ